MGKQKCEDTGPLTRKRMETIDDEVTAGAITFMDKAAKADKPFFLWWNSSRMHTYTHLSPKWEGKTRPGYRGGRHARARLAMSACCSMK